MCRKTWPRYILKISALSDFIPLIYWKYKMKTRGSITIERSTYFRKYILFLYVGFCFLSHSPDHTEWYSAKARVDIINGLWNENLKHVFHSSLVLFIALLILSASLTNFMHNAYLYLFKRFSSYRSDTFSKS